MEEDAGDRVDVVGGACALVWGGGLRLRRRAARICIRVRRRGIGFAGKQNGEPVAGEERADAASQGECDVLLENLVGKVRAGVGSAVSRVEKDEIVVDVRCGGFCGGLRLGCLCFGCGCRRGLRKAHVCSGGEQEREDGLAGGESHCG